VNMGRRLHSVFFGAVLPPPTMVAGAVSCEWPGCSWLRAAAEFQKSGLSAVGTPVSPAL
jgi:hypothetical protein